MEESDSIRSNGHTISVTGICFLGKGTLSVISSQATSKMIIVKLPFSMERRLGCRSR